MWVQVPRKLLIKKMKNSAIIITTILLFGLSVFFRKLSVERIHPYQLQIVAGLVYAFEIPIWLYLINKDSSISSYDLRGVVFGVLCIATHVIAAVLLGILMRSSNATGALATLVATNPVVTALLSYLILNEEFSGKKIIATCITLVGISLFNI